MSIHLHIVNGYCSVKIAESKSCDATSEVFAIWTFIKMFADPRPITWKVALISDE